MYEIETYAIPSFLPTPETVHPKSAPVTHSVVPFPKSGKQVRGYRNTLLNYIVADNGNNRKGKISDGHCAEDEPAVQFPSLPLLICHGKVAP